MSKRLFGCALAGALLLSLAPEPSGAAGPTSFTFRGRGHGHGRGMGQWGARDIAERGRAWKTILGFYYQGVAFQTLSRDPAIRVHVGTLSAATIGASGAFDVYEVGGRSLAQGMRGIIRVTPTQSGVTVTRSVDHDGPWTVVATSTRDIAFAPRDSYLGVVNAVGGGRYYRGSMTVHRVAAGTVWAIVTSSLEEYLRGVIPREMPSTWPTNALRAQAVAARTFAINAAQGSRARGLAYDTCSTTRCQVFGGAFRRAKPGAAAERLETSATDSAGRWTAGVVMTYGGAYILAEYSSSSGGYTAPGSKPYLRARPDSADGTSPHHTWSVSVPASKIEAAYPSVGDLQRILITERNGYGAEGGRALEVRLDGARADVLVDGTAFRRAAGLRSDWFAL